MDIIRFSINNPVKVSVGVLLIVMIGVLALLAIPIQLTPNVDKPIITVTTDWSGASPDEIEREIVDEQEEKLKSVANLKKMSSISYEGQSIVTLEFYVGADMREAVLEVSDKLREVREYPDDADEPVVDVSASSSESPIAWTIISSKDPKFDVASLHDYLDDQVKPFLERIDGVSEVRIYGGRKRQVHVQVDPQRMAQRGVTFKMVRDAISRANVNVSAGGVQDGRLEVRVRTVGEFNDLDKIRDTIVLDTTGGPIRVSDIGSVVVALEKERGFVRSRGRAGVALPIYREVGSNVMKIMEQVRLRMEDIRRDILPSIATQVAFDRQLAEAPEFVFEQVYDETLYIDDAIGLVTNNLWLAGSLTACILMLFLRSFRPTLIISLAIPISVIGTFVALFGAGRNINVVSLAGLAFAVGMVVDNAIVTLENIDRHISLGKKPREAAYDGAKEVWGAILASSLTTVAVFGPVLFIEEEAGQLFRDLALAICAAVLLSMLVSITVIPSAAVAILRHRSESKSAFIRSAKGLFGLAALLDRAVVGFSRFVYWLSQPRMDRIAMRLIIVAGLTVGAFVGAAILMPPTTYLPAGNRNLVFGFILTPPGYSKDHDRVLAHQVEAKVRPYWEAKSRADLKGMPPVLNKMTGQPIENIPPIENYFFVSVFRGMFTGATSAENDNVKPLEGLLTNSMGDIPGAYGGAFQRSLFETGLAGNNKIDVEVTGFNLDHIRASAGALFGELMKKYGPFAVRPNPSNFNLPGPEVQLKINEQRAKDLKLDVAELGRSVQTMVDGTIVGDYRTGGNTIDLLLVRDPKINISIDTLDTIPLAVPLRTGGMTIVPLLAVMDIVRADAPQTIQRIERQRSVTLEVTPPGEIPLEAIQSEIELMVADLRAKGIIPPTVAVSQAGTASKLNDVRAAMIGKWDKEPGSFWKNIGSLAMSRLFLALVVTYLLMAALFESWIYPIVILFSVPPAAVGGFIGLAIVHAINPLQQLDVVTMLGFVILIGTVVNSAILVVHQALNYMRGLGEGEGDSHGIIEPKEAIRLSVRTRVRPVLMTTITTLFGMMPLVLMPGAGSELYRGLGAVVLGGLVFSTVFSLFVVPLVFSLFIDLQVGIRRLLGLSLVPVAAPVEHASVPSSLRGQAPAAAAHGSVQPAGAQASHTSNPAAP
ncbi:MAG: efflux RND transporter permease subunit [Phycisphaeraceae bacterium]